MIFGRNEGILQNQGRFSLGILIFFLTQKKGDEMLFLKDNLKVLLKKQGITAADLSRDTGVSKQVLSDWMSGTQPRTLEQLYAVSKALRVSIEDLCFKKLARATGASESKSPKTTTFPLNFDAAFPIGRPLDISPEKHKEFFDTELANYRQTREMLLEQYSDMSDFEILEHYTLQQLSNIKLLVIPLASARGSSLSEPRLFHKPSNDQGKRTKK